MNIQDGAERNVIASLLLELQIQVLQHAAVKARYDYCILLWTAARLAQLGERRSAEREAVGSNPGRTNTQGL